MKATTIKVEGDMLKELERLKPPSQTLSGYVRSLLQHEIQRRKIAEAAGRYTEYLRETPEERTWLEEWVNADLSTPPKPRRR
jgi:hypothetical protein